MIRDAIAEVAVFLAKRHLFPKGPATDDARLGRQAWESIAEKLAPTDGAILESFGRNRHSLAAGDALKGRILLHCEDDPAWEGQLQHLASLFSQRLAHHSPSDC